jgi:hypothetical protein
MSLAEALRVGVSFWMEWAELHFFRANGNCKCPTCDEEYWRHQFTPHRSWNDDPYLHLLCNGWVVKL